MEPECPKCGGPLHVSEGCAAPWPCLHRAQCPACGHACAVWGAQADAADAAEDCGPFFTDPRRAAACSGRWTRSGWS